MRTRVVLILTILGLTLAVTAAPVAAGTSPIITLTKTDTPDPVLPGGILTYTIVLTNCALCAPGIVGVQDPVPTGTSVQSTTATTGTVEVSGSPLSVHWSVPLGTDAAETLIIALLVDPGTPPGTIIQNTATASASNQVTAFAETTVGAPPTPAASLADAAMAPATNGGPLAALGFAALLLGALGVLVAATARGVAKPR